MVRWSSPQSRGIGGASFWERKPHRGPITQALADLLFGFWITAEGVVRETERPAARIVDLCVVPILKIGAVGPLLLRGVLKPDGNA